MTTETIKKAMEQQKVVEAPKPTEYRVKRNPSYRDDFTIEGRNPQTGKWERQFSRVKREFVDEWLKKEGQDPKETKGHPDYMGEAKGAKENLEKLYYKGKPEITSDLKYAVEKYGIPKKGVSIKKDLESRPVLLNGGYKLGVLTDGFLLIEDRQATDDILSKYLEADNKKTVDKLVENYGHSRAEAEKNVTKGFNEAIAKGAEQFPQYKKLYPDPYWSEVKLVGVWAGSELGGDFADDAKAYLSDSEHIIPVSMNKLALICKYLPDLKAIKIGRPHTPLGSGGNKTSGPVAFIENGKAKALLMPIFIQDFPDEIKKASKKARVQREPYYHKWHDAMKDTVYGLSKGVGEDVILKQLTNPKGKHHFNEYDARALIREAQEKPESQPKEPVALKKGTHAHTFRQIKSGKTLLLTNRSKTKFATLGKITGGHYSWGSKEGFSLCVTTYKFAPISYSRMERVGVDGIHQPDAIGVHEALRKLNTEHPDLTEQSWTDTSIPVHVAEKLGWDKRKVNILRTRQDKLTGKFIVSGYHNLRSIDISFDRKDQAKEFVKRMDKGESIDDALRAIWKQPPTRREPPLAPTEQQKADARKYITRIKNPAKHDYALVYYAYLKGARDTEPEQPKNLSVMGAQAVEMELRRLMSSKESKRKLRLKSEQTTQGEVLVIYDKTGPIGNFLLEKVGKDKQGVTLRWMDADNERHEIHFVGATEESIRRDFERLVEKHIDPTNVKKEDIITKTARKHFYKRPSVAHLVGKRYKLPDGTIYQLVDYNDLNIPYFSKVKGNKVGKKKYTLPIWSPEMKPLEPKVRAEKPPAGKLTVGKLKEVHGKRSAISRGVDRSKTAKSVLTPSKAHPWLKAPHRHDVRNVDTRLKSKKVGRVYHTKVGKGKVLSRHPLGGRRGK